MNIGQALLALLEGDALTTFGPILAQGAAAEAAANGDPVKLTLGGTALANQLIAAAPTALGALAGQIFTAVGARVQAKIGSAPASIAAAEQVLAGTAPATAPAAPPA